MADPAFSACDGPADAEGPAAAEGPAVAATASPSSHPRPASAAARPAASRFAFCFSCQIRKFWSYSCVLWAQRKGGGWQGTSERGARQGTWARERVGRDIGEGGP
eukprot:scaffold216_cov78-Isochrysis_galbana.AAC.3